MIFNSLTIPFIQLSFFIFVLTFFIFFDKSYGTMIHVKTSLGEIIGEETGHDLGIKVNRFLGIPYAKPPIGNLRFAVPHSVDAFKKPFYALKWPSQCIQNETSFINLRWRHYNYNNHTSEDCLYLNIWSPNIQKNASLPVLVWIHGGGMFSGSSSFEIYESSWLSNALNAVIVTINYRVGILGYLYSENISDVPGNQGLRDQIEALRWIQQNIGSFGGDSRQVTIWGQSAGSWSVSAHILMPESRSLFKNAIMMSGAALTINAISTPQFYLDAISSGIKNVNCSVGANNSITFETIQCLRKLNANQIDEILYRLPISSHSKMPLFVMDGKLFPKRPKDLFKSGQFKGDVNLLLSTVEDEGSFILNSIGGHYAIENPTPLTLVESRNFLEAYSANVFPPHNYPKKLVDYFYFTGISDTFNNSFSVSETQWTNHIRRQTARAVGDGQLACPTIEFGRRVTRYGNGRVYSMRFRAKIGALKMLCSHWSAGACHCDDLYPAFGMPFRYRSEYTERERQISREYLYIFANFIRFGKPRNDREWPPAMVNRENIISPVYEIHADFSRQSGNYIINAEHDKCQFLWNKFLAV